MTPTLLSDEPASPVPSHQPSIVRTSRLTFTSHVPVPNPTRAGRRPSTAAAIALAVAFTICRTY
ncbi:hypothetical protein [Streptomyces phaeochromogenes]|uniref:hypothetical protein n=1 Tax=Streptomyces phaeochromogenes TaxID=1923 RepID=UPI0012FEFABE|nr:hypothetical protein [Streptomyces phaeochromogenes]